MGALVCFFMLGALLCKGASSIVGALLCGAAVGVELIGNCPTGGDGAIGATGGVDI